VFVDVTLEYNLFSKHIARLDFIIAQQLRISAINNILLFSCFFGNINLCYVFHSCCLTKAHRSKLANHAVICEVLC
jgi:hypothetical protein